MKAIYLIVGLALAACGSSGPPTPPIQPIPPAAPRPGSPVVIANWASPLSASGTCGGSPFACDLPAGVQWGLLQATDLSRFSPTGTALNWATDPLSGMALISATRLDPTQPMSVEVVARIDSLNCSASVSYHGGVIYDGGKDDGDPFGNYVYLVLSRGPHAEALAIYPDVGRTGSRFPDDRARVDPRASHRLVPR